MKYFFLSDGWSYNRIWEFGGLWNENIWQRKPEIKRLNIAIVEQGETLWLYQVEDSVLMIEVNPTSTEAAQKSDSIGQVVLKRLIGAEEIIQRLNRAETILNKIFLT